MKDYLLFKEKGSRNVCAVHRGATGSRIVEAIASVFSHDNSAVASTGVSVGFLREECYRISEKRARAIHPLLFQRLDSK